MGIFFKKMSEKETKNWKKGCVVGFYAFLIALFINQIYYNFFNSYFLSNFSVFWIGLISAFAWSFILNVKSVKRKGK
ncbi:hypothetical protein Q73_05945 [Bacillus coahuilensis m2-6]|nr:hypothetical protein Q73_05945 [Bacillus coahuilensis m2-6]